MTTRKRLCISDVLLKSFILEITLTRLNSASMWVVCVFGELDVIPILNRKKMRSLKRKLKVGMNSKAPKEPKIFPFQAEK